MTTVPAGLGLISTAVDGSLMGFWAKNCVQDSRPMWVDFDGDEKWGGASRDLMDGCERRGCLETYV